MANDLSQTPPLPSHALNRLRLLYRTRSPSAGLGAHRHRRMGQSLEFRDFRDYVPGDDVRAIDWPASLRSGSKIIRSFEAEERRTLIILVDCRPAMRLPKGADKLTVALWIAQLLVDAALAERDLAVVVPLFSARNFPPLTIRSGRDKQALARLIAALRAPLVDAHDWNTGHEIQGRGIEAVLRPAAAVVLLSDMLFSDDQGQVAALARRAQASYRSLHVFELQSWPFERALLASGPFRLGSLEGRDFGEAHFEAAASLLDQAQTAMQAHRHALQRKFIGPGLVWPGQAMHWPNAPAVNRAAFEEWFRAAFQHASVLPSLLSRAGR